MGGLETRIGRLEAASCWSHAGSSSLNLSLQTIQFTFKLFEVAHRFFNVFFSKIPVPFLIGPHGCCPDGDRFGVNVKRPPVAVR